MKKILYIVFPIFIEVSSEAANISNNIEIKITYLPKLTLPAKNNSTLRLQDIASVNLKMRGLKKKENHDSFHIEGNW